MSWVDLFQYMKSKLSILLCILFLTGCATTQQPVSVSSVPTSTGATRKSFADVSKNTSKVATSTQRVSPEVVSTTPLWYQPKPGVSWQWQLSGDINSSYTVDVYDVDLVETPQVVIDQLHRRGVKVICYFSAGTFEEYREDAALFSREVVGKELEDWPDEKWLDVAHYERFASVMEKRLDLAVQKKCDGVEPDNVDGYDNDTGFRLTSEDQLKYNRWLAEQAHMRGLAVGLKNDLPQIKTLVDYFDFAVNEQCFEYEECDQLLPFIEQKKAVFGVEYELETEDFCDQANRMNLSWLKMEYELDGGRVACR